MPDLTPLFNPFIDYGREPRERATSELPQTPITNWDDLLREITYWPNYRLEYRSYGDVDWQQGQIFVHVTTIDSYNPDRELVVTHRNPVPPYQSLREGAALEILQSILHKVACHEVDEGLRFRGEMIFDPHK